MNTIKTQFSFVFTKTYLLSVTSSKQHKYLTSISTGVDESISSKCSQLQLLQRTRMGSPSSRARWTCTQLGTQCLSTARRPPPVHRLASSSTSMALGYVNTLYEKYCTSLCDRLDIRLINIKSMLSGHHINQCT